MAKNTDYRLFTAYSDPSANELGTIYQACNFIYLGRGYGKQQEYRDPEFPQLGWFGHRRFATASVYKLYAEKLGIEWQKSWGSGTTFSKERLPGDVRTALDLECKRAKLRCERRNLPPKHKYAILLGPNRRETRAYQQIFRTMNPQFEGLAYPKQRGK